MYIRISKLRLFASPNSSTLFPASAVTELEFELVPYVHLFHLQVEGWKKDADRQMTRLLTHEFAQSTSDELVADAAKALKEGAADLEPDLFLLTQADFESLGPSATECGRKSVLAMQAALLQDAGDPGITEKDMQSLCVDGLNDLNLSDLFMEKAIKLRRRGMAKIYTATAGGPEEGFSDFLAEIYAPTGSGATGGSRTATPARPAQGSEPVKSATTVAESEPVIAPSPAPSSTAGDQEDFCPLSECKIVFPLNAETLPTSGVPVEYISARFSDGSYGCLWEDCDQKASSRPAVATHIRRKHLGIALGCKLCPAKQFYKHGSWQDHMKKSHPGVAPAAWYMNPSEGVQSAHAPGITVEELATVLATPAVQRAMANPTPTPAPVHESEPAESVPTGTPAEQKPSPVKIKKEDPEPGTSRVVGQAIVLKRPARSSRSEPGSAIKEEEQDKPPGPPPKKMKPTWEPADDDEDDDDVIFIE